MVTKSAVIGIDIGASTSYVSYVGKGMVDLVQNEVSQRATNTLVGFTDRERLLGDAALAQIKSNAKNTCRNFKHLLGRKIGSPDVKSEHFWSTCKLGTCEDGFVGYDVSYKGESRMFSPVQITAMFLTKLTEITEKWCQAKVADAVISVPASFSDVHRQALLDAAKISGLSVLRLMNEHTATALAYGIYRSNDFDPEKPMNVAFCAMGHSMFSVSVVQFVRGKLHVLCEKHDKVGGRDMDECLMRKFAERFQEKYKMDPLSTKKSSFKLEDSVTKTKKILSANSEAGLNVECLMEDYDFSSQMDRAMFEEMCKPMMARVKAVLDDALAMLRSGAEEHGCAGCENIDSVEIVGGASRVPWVKRMCSEAFGGKELSTTMNADESVARGCALQAAILSPLYKVRDFKVDDTSPFAVRVGWMGSAADTNAAKDDDGDTQMVGGEGEYKTAVIFPAGSTLGTTKMLTFNRTGDFEMKAEYVDANALLPDTPKELGSFKIVLPKQDVVKKVKVKAMLTGHCMFSVEGAQLVEEEEYEEMTKEKRELPPEETAEEAPKAEGGEPAAGGKAEAKPDAPMADKGDTQDGEKENAEKTGEGTEQKAPEKKAPEKKYEWVEVMKKKRRTKKTDLVIDASNRPGLSATALEARTSEETAMKSEMKELIETDEKRNDLESYIFNMRDKIVGEYADFISTAEAETFNKDLTTAEDWLYDNEGAKKVEYIEKLDALKVVGDATVWRSKEHSMRAEWIQAVEGTIVNYRAAADNPGEKYGHIAGEKLAKIAEACDELSQWLKDNAAKQEQLPKWQRPVLICADMEKKNQELAKTCDKILKEPKPAPPKEEEKKEEKKEENGTGTTKDQAPKEEAKGPQNMDVD